jgi:hypothetical protein
VPERRGASREAAIHRQRNSIERRIRKTPSLQNSLGDSDWWADAWDDAVEAASKETGMAFTTFSEKCPWSSEEVLDQTFFPGTGKTASPKY